MRLSALLLFAGIALSCVSDPEPEPLYPPIDPPGGSGGGPPTAPPPACDSTCGARRIARLDRCDGTWNTCCQNTNDCGPNGACTAAKNVCYDAANIIFQQCLIHCDVYGTPIQ